MKKILITGATDGIGLETSKLLASQGHSLILHGRNSEKLATASAALSEIAPNCVLSSHLADLSNLDETKTFAQSILKENGAPDVIINNAGVFKTNKPEIQNGLDIRFVVNTLAPYLLTKLLLPSLPSDARVINLSSAAQAPVDLEALMGKKKITDDFQAYAQSKLAITIWSRELAKTFTPEQVICAVNPGSLLASKMVKEGFGVQGNSLSIGADILCRAALSDEFLNASGKYFDNDIQRFSDPHPDALNTAKCAKIMAALDQLVLNKL